jgi:hypothetical protein
VIRQAVCHPCWQVTAQHLTPAARLVNGRPTTTQAFDAVSLIEAMWNTACAPIGVTEARVAVARAVGASLNEVSAKEQSVVVDSTSVLRPGLRDVGAR